MRKINLGCGNDIKKGWINIDSVKLNGVDYVVNLSSDKLPFDDESIDEVLCQDVMEHVDYIFLMREIHRILKPQAKVYIRVPHFSYHRAYEDPTHIHYFSAETFDFFVKAHKRNYYFDFGFSQRRRKLTFIKKYYLPLNWLVEYIVNVNSALLYLYEVSFLRAIFPSENIEVELVK